MRRIASLGFALMLGVSAGVHAQELVAPIAVPAPTQSAIRVLIEQPGAVVVARRSPLDPIPVVGGSLQISALGAFEPGAEAQRILGVQIDLTLPDLSPAEGRHYLDVHEIEALLKALFLLDQVAGDSKAGFVSTADYATIEGFTVGVEVGAGSPRFWVEGGHAERRRSAIARNAVGTLRQRLELARARLFTQ